MIMGGREGIERMMANPPKGASTKALKLSK